MSRGTRIESRDSGGALAPQRPPESEVSGGNALFLSDNVPDYILFFSAAARRAESLTG